MEDLGVLEETATRTGGGVGGSHCFCACEVNASWDHCGRARCKRQGPGTSAGCRPLEVSVSSHAALVRVKLATMSPPFCANQDDILINGVAEWECGARAASSHTSETKALYDAPYKALFQSSFTSPIKIIK